MSYTQRVAGFIPEIWSKSLLANWDETFVYGKLVNTEYEGEVKKVGDTVHMRYVNNPVVGAYDNTASPPIDWGNANRNIAGGDETLIIDQQQYWATCVEDLEAHQSDVDYRNKILGQANIALKDVVETYLFQTLMPFSVSGGATVGIAHILAYCGATGMTVYNAATDYAAGAIVAKSTTTDGNLYVKLTDAFAGGATEPTWVNTIGSQANDGDGDTYETIGVDANVALAASNFYSMCVKAKRMFRKKNTWRDGQMWMVIPPEVEELLSTSTELTHATDKADKLIEMGLYGNVAGFNILVSNNLTGAGTAASPFKMFAGNMDAVCFAMAYLNTDAVVLTDRFGTGVRGLAAYGAKVPVHHEYAALEIRAVL